MAQAISFLTPYSCGSRAVTERTRVKRLQGQFLVANESLRSLNPLNQESHVFSFARASLASSRGEKQVWISTKSKDVITAAVECGWSTVLVKEDGSAQDWSSLARIRVLNVEDGEIIEAHDGSSIGKYCNVSCGEDLESLSRLSETEENIVMDSSNWQIIPAENVVAAFQNRKCKAFSVASDASGAIVALQALESGVDGIVLRTDNPSDILEFKNAFDKSYKANQRVNLSAATITHVQPIGMGHRVCVDLCSQLVPGEGLLVGSFARGLFLVHSECLKVDYVSSRPFRVNAGPVHSYVAMPGGKTAYLAELKTGTEVLIVDKLGQTRTAVVGRVKIESRPLILIDAEVEGDGHTQSIILQNAETVRLLDSGSVPDDCKTISVSEIKVGDRVLVAVQDSAARHTGIAIDEYIVEK